MDCEAADVMTANPKREPFGHNTDHGLSVETARFLGLSLLQKGDWDEENADEKIPGLLVTAKAFSG